MAIEYLGRNGFFRLSGNGGEIAFEGLMLPGRIYELPKDNARVKALLAAGLARRASRADKPAVAKLPAKLAQED